MKLYKWVDENLQTRNGMQWGEDITHEITLPGNKLCSSQVLHGYNNLYLAMLMKPAHVSEYSLLMEAKGHIVANDGTKIGCKKMTTLRIVEIPEVTIEQRVEFAIRVSLLVYDEPGYVEWARKWLSGEDRTAHAAAYTADAAYAANTADTYATAYAADAANTAYAAAHAADAAYAADADAARAAADAAADVADNAADKAKFKRGVKRILKKMFGGE